MVRLGAFLSITKGIDKVVPQALEIGANTFQFFTRNPRGGGARTIGDDEIARWFKAAREADIAQVCGHLPYTVNLASDKENLIEFASMVVADDLRRMAALGIDYLVVHPGSASDRRTDALHRIIRLLDKVLEESGSSVCLLLETMATQGNEVGSIEEIAAIWHALGRPQQVGVCLDSCHLFAAGYDFTKAQEVERLVADLDASIGLEPVKVLHLNDSKMPSGSRRDRHANIGQGEIGEEGFANLLHHPFVRRLAWHLETPVTTYRDYAQDIARVKAIIGAE